MEPKDQQHTFESRAFDPTQFEFEDRQFEAALRRAMQPLDAPAAFAEKVMTQAGVVDAPRRATLLMMPARTRAWLSGALAAGMLGGIFWAGQLHVRRERERAEMAQRQFQDGVRITDRALDHARAQLQRSGVFGD